MTFYSEMLRLLGYLVGFLVFVALNAAYLVWVERKVAGHIQRRIGPKEVGPYGLLQPLADGFKLMTLTEARTQTLRLLVLCVGAAFAATSVLCLFAKGTLFYGAYRVDLFSQLVKCVMSIGFTLMLLFGADTKGISVRMIALLVSVGECP